MRRGHTAVPRGSGNPCRRSCSPSICTAERVKSANPLNPRLSKTSKGAGTPQTHPWGSSAGRMLETPQDCTRGTPCSTTAARGVLPAGNSTSRAHPFPSPPVQRCRALRSSSPNIAASNSSINNASLLLPLAAVFLLLTCVSFLLTAASALPARPNRDTATAGWGRQLPLPAAPGRAAASPTPGTAQGSLLPLQASCSVQTDGMHSAAAHTTLLHAVLSRALGTEVGGHIPLLPPCLCAGTALLGTVSPQIPNSGLRQRLGPTVSTLPFPGCSRCHAPAHSCPRAEPRTSQCMPARVLRLAPCLVEQRAASCSRRQGGRSWGRHRQLSAGASGLRTTLAGISPKEDMCQGVLSRGIARWALGRGLTPRCPPSSRHPGTAPPGLRCRNLALLPVQAPRRRGGAQGRRLLQRAGAPAHPRHTGLLRQRPPGPATEQGVICTPQRGWS